jgi:hypothetical protein
MNKILFHISKVKQNFKTLFWFFFRVKIWSLQDKY